MSFYCTHCERSFRWKASLLRHKDRKTPCRKALFNCLDCNKVFVSKQSLGKHKVLYCKNNARCNRTPLSDILERLIERDMTVNENNVLSDDFLNFIDKEQVNKDAVSSKIEGENYSTKEDIPCQMPENVDKNVPIGDNSVSNCFDEIINSWIKQLFMLEGKFIGDLSSHGEAFKIIDRMLQDGLITSYDHGELYYSTRLFIRLHKIHEMGMTSVLKEEYLDILITLFEMKKLSQAALKTLLLSM